MVSRSSMKILHTFALINNVQCDVTTRGVRAHFTSNECDITFFWTLYNVNKKKNCFIFSKPDIINMKSLVFPNFLILRQKYFISSEFNYLDKTLNFFCIIKKNNHRTNNTQKYWQYVPVVCFYEINAFEFKKNALNECCFYFTLCTCCRNSTNSNFFFNLCIFFNFFRFWSQRIKLTLQSSLAVVFRRTVPATKLSFPSSSSSKNTTKS